MKKIFSIFLVFTIGIIFSFSLSFAQTREEIETQINELENKITDLGKQKNTLSSQITSMDSQIKLTTLKISQTQEQINVLTDKIGRLEVSLDSLAKILGKRISETYKKGKIDTISLLFSTQKFTDLLNKFKYLKVLQIHDRKLMLSMEETKVNYDDQKTEVEALKAKMESQKKLLAQQKKEKENLLLVTKNDEKKYQQLLAQAKAQLEQFKRFTISQGGASILSNQTKCDSWGCYYNQRDSLWGNMFLGGTNYSMKDSGCFITSVAMLANHFGKDIKPNDIAQLSVAVTSEGELKWSFNVNGVNVSISSASSSSLDNELSKGPVIAGLYPGPAHFIVILRKEGSNYIMHDPFLENGANRPLTDKYNVSNITSLRLVQFN